MGDEKKLKVTGEVDGMPVYELDLSKFRATLPHPNPSYTNMADVPGFPPYPPTEEELAERANAERIEELEGDVIDAALALARVPTHIDHREEFEAAEDKVREAALALIKARGE